MKLHFPEIEKMISIFPETLSSALLTLLFGVCAYFAICWIRLKEKSPKDKEAENNSIFDVAYNDFKSVISLFKKEEKKTENDTPKEVKPKKSQLRRNKSHNSLKNSDIQQRNVLVRQSSQGSINIRFSMNSFINIKYLLLGNQVNIDSSDNSDTECESPSSIRRVLYCYNKVTIIHRVLA